MSLVEPIAEPADAAVGADGHTKEAACLNCAAPLVGDYCYGCGQKAHVHRSLGAFAHDLLHGVLHFEGKVWRTLPMLAWRPGELTRRYVAGERARFVGPLPLFLFCVFLLFAVVSSTGPISLDSTPPTRAELEQKVREGSAELADYERQRAAAIRSGSRARVAFIEGQMESVREDVAVARAMLGGATPEQAERAAEAQTSRTKLAAQEMKDDSPRWYARFDQAYREAKKNPDLMLFKLKSNGYKYSWALIPLSLPLMWLLFPSRRKWRTYDHAVFVTYSLCFMTLLVVIGMLLLAAGFVPALFLAFLPPIHMYRQLRGAYLLSHLSTAWRTALMTLGALVIFALFSLVVLVLGVIK